MENIWKVRQEGVLFTEKDFTDLCGQTVEDVNNFFLSTICVDNSC